MYLTGKIIKNIYITKIITNVDNTLFSKLTSHDNTPERPKLFGEIIELLSGIPFNLEIKT